MSSSQPLKYPYDNPAVLEFAKDRGLNRRTSYHQVFVDLEAGGCLDIEDVASVTVYEEDGHVEVESREAKVWTVPIGPEGASYWHKMVDALENGDDI